MKKNSWYIVPLVALGIFAFAAFAGRFSARAQTSSNCPVTVPSGGNCLSGWAWSSNIGWISFNSADTNAGGGPYAVTVDGSGNLGGYAWSPNVGWISFNPSDLTGCTGTTAGAQVNLTSGAVTGGARIISGEGRTDGWDGCIQLSDNHYYKTQDTTGSSGVTYNSSNGQFNGYGWGGNVLGWIDFSPSISVNGNTTPPVNPVQINPSSNTITVSCSIATPSPIAPGSVSFQATASGGTGPYQYSWGANNSYASANTYSATYSTSGSGPTVYAKDTSSGAVSSVACRSVVINNAPTTPITLTLYKSPTSTGGPNITITEGDPAYIEWASSDSLTGYTCLVTTTLPPLNTVWESAIPAGTLLGDTFASASPWPYPIASSANPLAHGTYTIQMSCTLSGQPTLQSNTATITVNKESVGEI